MKAFDLKLEEMSALLSVLDRSAAAETLAPSELRRVEATLGEYVAEAARLLEKRRRELDDAKALLRTMLARIRQCEAARRSSQ